MTADVKYDVIVVGAGAAGLTAARRLTEAGLKILLLESRDRIGGRLFSVSDPALGVSLELGAEFVHSTYEGLHTALREANVPIQEAPWRPVRLDEGRTLAGGFQQEFEKLMDGLPAPHSEPDISFEQFLERTNFPNPQAVVHARAYVEGYNAAHSSLISAQSLHIANNAPDDVESEEQFRVMSAYSSLASWLLQQCRQERLTTRLGEGVTSICWGDVWSTVRTINGDLFEGKRILLTVPLPVLKSRIEFQPQLPESKLRCLSLIETGYAQRIAFCFKSKFWLTLEHLDLSNSTFFFAPEPPFRTWWTLGTLAAPVLVGWNSGRPALPGLEAEELVEIALTKLARMLGVTADLIREQLVSYHYHDWIADENSLGAYSYCLVGGIDAPKDLGEPVHDKLYFAGEATAFEGDIGTVHGAMKSGLRAAEQILTSSLLLENRV